MLKKIKNLLAVLGLIIVLCVGFYYYGRLKGLTAKQSKPVVSSQIILDKIVEQSFLVTRTLFLDSKAEIKIQEANGWKGFFVGQTINAQGTVRVDVGVDLKKMKPEDIVIDVKNKTVNVYLPAAEIMDSSIFGNVEIQNKKGVWTNVKDLFNNDKSEDYNLAVNELVSQANAAAKSKENIFQEVNTGASSFAAFVVGNLLPGYTVQVGQK
jgi:hypothetical protein